MPRRELDEQCELRKALNEQALGREYTFRDTGAKPRATDRLGNRVAS